MKYKITKIHPDDAYYVNQDSIIGALVEVDEIFSDDGIWLGASLKYIGRKKIKFTYQGEEIEYTKGESFLFYQVQIEEVK